MPNAVLERLREQRAVQIEFIDQTLERVEAEGRDLVQAETDNLASTRQRIAELDAQITPLEEFEQLRTAGAEGARRHLSPSPTGEEGGQRRASLSGVVEPPLYRTAGEFLVDTVKARGLFGTDRDTAAVERVTRAVAKQTTADTPGLLPTPIVGPVLNLIDTSRPFITSVGARPLGGIAGTGFTRPKVTQHVVVGEQTGGEKTELPSRPMKITPVPFAKKTYGGCVNVSRQDIDWTSPSAWDALVTDLADIYGQATEAAAAAVFAAGITQSVALTTNDLKGWATALYLAAAKVYRGGKRLPDRIWVSLDMWAVLGAIVDVARVSGSGGIDLGNSELAAFAGDVFKLPRIVVPDLPPGTVVLGASPLHEVYEERIGLLSAIEPSILGVEVAYGGYMTSGFMEAGGFCAITGGGGLTIGNIAPATGPAAGNTSVTITGTGFQNTDG